MFSPSSQSMMPEEREALLDRYCNKLDVGCNVCLVAICAHICVRIYLAISTSIAELFILESVVLKVYLR